MPATFAAAVSSSATVEQVHAAFGDESYWSARFVAFDVDCALDGLTVGPDGTVTVSATQDLRRGRLPRPVAAVYPGDITIRQTERWQPVGDGSVRGELRVEVRGAPGSGHGTGQLTPTEVGSQLSFTGAVTFKVPLVGGRIEKYLAAQFADQVPAIERFTTSWIDERRYGHAHG